MTKIDEAFVSHNNNAMGRDQFELRSDAISRPRVTEPQTSLKRKSLAYFRIKSQDPHQQLHGGKKKAAETEWVSSVSRPSEDAPQTRYNSIGSTSSSSSSNLIKKTRLSLIGLKKTTKPETTVEGETQMRTGRGISLFKSPSKRSTSTIIDESEGKYDSAISYLETKDTQNNSLHPEFVTSTATEAQVSSQARPMYNRSISFQTKKADDEERSTLSQVSSSSSDFTDLDTTILADAENSQHKTSPKKLRQRSRTVGDTENSHQRSISCFAKPLVSDASNTTKPRGQLQGFGNTEINSSRSSSNMLSCFTNLVKARRSSSILALDDYSRGAEIQVTPGYTPSEKTELSTTGTDSHLSPPTSSSTDYFSHRSRASSATGHKSTYSVSSIERSFALVAQDDETPEAYVKRVIVSNYVSDLAPAITNKPSDFNKESLKHFLKFFEFQKEPLDVSLRKFLALTELPKETQAIDRVLYAFAEEYCAQNPYIGYSAELCFILSFSLLLLHTDHFNPNNKRKMTKIQFSKIVKESLQSHLKTASETEKNQMEFTVKNVISKEILEYFYDNITFVPFKRLDHYSKEFFLQVNHYKRANLLVKEDEIFNTPDDESAQFSNKTFIKSNLSTSSLALGAPTRKRASSFFISVSAGSDNIYEYILGARDISELRLGYAFQHTNPFVSMQNDSGLSQISENYYGSNEDNILTETEDRIDEIDAGVFQKLIEAMASSTPKVILKFTSARAQNIKADGKVEVVGEISDQASLVTRVFKMGTVYRQEAKKLTSATLWKSYFAVLTFVGIIFYKDISSLNFTEIVGEDGKVTTVLEEQSSTGFFESAADSGVIVYNHGLFAMRNMPDTSKKSSNQLQMQLESAKFTIYGKNSKDLCAASDKEEMREWVFNIDYLAALNDCYLGTEPRRLEILKDQEMVEVRSTASMTMLQKVNKSNRVLTSSLELLKKLFGVCDSLTLLMPFHSRTKELATYSAKLIDTRIMWSWFELNKNLVITKVLLYAINTQEELARDDDIPCSVTDIKADSLHREKTAASVAAVVDYNLDNSIIAQEATSDADTESDENSISSKSVYYDCDAITK